MQVEYWVKSAENDLETAESLIKEKKFDWALFMGHQVLEKILKAIYVECKRTFPPKTHDLILLLKEMNLHIGDTELDFFAEVNTFNISPGSSDDQFKINKLFTKEFSLAKFKEIQRKYQWLKEKLKK